MWKVALPWGDSLTVLWIKFVGWTLLLGGWDQCHLPCLSSFGWPSLVTLNLSELHVEGSLVWLLSVRYPIHHRQKLVFHQSAISDGLERILNWSHPGHSCWLALAEPLNCCSMGLDHFPTLTHTHPNRPVKPTAPHPHTPLHPPFSNAQYTCTASLALTFNMSKLNSLVFSLLPLRPCFALFARTAAVRRRP